MTESPVVQAGPGPFWRDRGFWVQAVIQSALFLFFGAVDLASRVNVDDHSDHTVTALLLIAGYGITFVGLLLQRRRPEPGLAVVAVGLVTVAASLSGIYVLAAGIVGYEAWFISGFIRLRRRLWLGVLLVGAVTTAVLAVLSPVKGIGWGGAQGAEELYGVAPTVRETAVALTVLTVLILVSVALCWQLGLGVRHQHERIENLAARAELAAVAERNRIAREMHDIVAHKISLVALQAGALEVNPNLEREKVVESAGLIRSTATEALSELRQVLGVLRGADDGAPLAPQPTWEDVRRLVDSSREAGVEVDLYDFVDDPVPDALARTVYRVVQESLTNIHKHARRTAGRVALIGEPGADLVIEVSNVLPQGFQTELPGARMGLSGIETRVLHAGGTITSGPTEDGRFAVKAVIPWPAPSA